MAFNFNWSPLLADTSRAREMLTSALNKSPKPPIIVDDIVVTELNLGTTPPELEILEIGDLAEDRFRGIFRMQYSGDAFLTLKTRVQANPLQTFLSDKPSFASPQPLAAASGLTIPIAITLSEIKLSGFVILVFSKQKGITVVFRNDPLESLKVSSTFDSISFVRNYLQRQIEGQLRVLFMEDLPAIIHRLSLRIWSQEHQDTEANSNSNRVEDATSSEKPVDPLATPSQRPFDALRPFEEADVSNLTLDTPAERNFSTKNLLRLAALSDSNRTLSLFTPPIKDVVFRAWTGSNDRAEFSGGIAPISSATLASLSTHASARNSVGSAASISDSGMTSDSIHVRPTLSSTSSVYSGTPASSFGGPRTRLHGRKRKNRVVDLRKKQQEPGEEAIVAADTPSESRSTTPTSSAPSSSQAAFSSSANTHEDEVNTPPESPEKTDKGKQHEQHPPHIYSPRPGRSAAVQKAHAAMIDGIAREETLKGRPGPQRAQTVDAAVDPQATLRRSRRKRHVEAPRLQHSQSTFGTAPEKAASPQSGGILEQAWMMKMASEIAQKAQDEKEGRRSSSGFWGSSDPGDSDGPPPYAA